MCSRSPGHGHSYRRGCSRGCPRRPRDPRPPQRPPDGRVRVAGLAGDQPRPPAAATPRRADPRLLARPAAAAGSDAAATNDPRDSASDRRCSSRRLRPAPPPLASRRRRDAAASRRLTTRTARLDIADQRTTTSESETSVTVKPHPGPSFDCEPSQTHSLEGGPDDLLSRPQPVEARHLAVVPEHVGSSGPPWRLSAVEGSSAPRRHRMDLHANAALSWSGRRELARRVVDAGLDADGGGRGRRRQRPLRPQVGRPLSRGRPAAARSVVGAASGRQSNCAGAGRGDRRSCVGCG